MAPAEGEVGEAMDEDYRRGGGAAGGEGFEVVVGVS